MSFSGDVFVHLFVASPEYIILISVMLYAIVTVIAMKWAGVFRSTHDDGDEDDDCCESDTKSNYMSDDDSDVHVDSEVSDSGIDASGYGSDDGLPL